MRAVLKRIRRAGRWHDVHLTDAKNRAGFSATTRFRQRRRAWLSRIWWTLPALVLCPAATVAVLMQILHAGHTAFALGFGVGAGLGALMVWVDSPPERIDRWRRGAQGEKDTARALRPLVRQGWHVFNDIDIRHGSIDHVLIGPPGVFVLDTKSLGGRVRVTRGVVSVKWREDPDDGYTNRSMAARVATAADRVRGELKVRGIQPEVQPVVVLWADFAQESILSSRGGSGPVASPTRVSRTMSRSQQF